MRWGFDKVDLLPQDIGMPKVNWKATLLVSAVAMTLLRVFLAAKLGLGDDEAYYWDWSRHLELSYYDHPGMTAWLIKAATLIFGQTPIAVRLFALICNALSGYVLWRLARRMFGETTAAIAVAFYLFAPIFSVGGVLMVPDAPMGLAWMVVCLLCWRIVGESDNRWRLWLAAGAILGLGLLSKYTIILLALSFVLLLMSEREWRQKLAAPRFWITVGIACVLCLPIIVWNVHYSWPTLKYHLHDRQTGGGGANFNRWGQFFASQAIILSPALFLLCLGAWGYAITHWRDRRWRFLFLLSAPTFLLFAAQALFAEFKPHWTTPAFSLLFIGAAELLRSGFGLAEGRGRRWAQTVVAFAIAVIVVPLNILFYTGTLTPVIPKLARWFAPSAPWEPKFDPTNDLFGWPEVAAEAERVRLDWAQKSGESKPFLSSSRYQLVAQLAFVTGEQVWRVSPGSDQYSFWQTPETWRPLIGQSSIFITDNRFERDPRNDQIFSSCELLPPFDVYRSDELARRFNLWLCHGFLGFH